MWCGSSVAKLFPWLYSLGFFFNTLGTTISSGTLVSICHSFLSLTAKFQTRFNLFVSLFFFRLPLLISYKLWLGICLIVPDISLKYHFFSIFSEDRSSFWEVLHKSSFSAKWHANLHANLIKIALHLRYFSKNLTPSSEQ